MANRKDEKLRMAVRTAYVVKRWSAQRCAKEFGIHETTIKTWASKEGWAKERDSIATDGREAATQEIRKTIRLEADKRQELIDGLGISAAARIQKAAAAIDRISPVKHPRMYVAATRDLVEMVDRLMKAIKVAGEDVPSERDDQIEIIQRRVEPYRIAVNENGRPVMGELLPPEDDDDDNG